LTPQPSVTALVPAVLDRNIFRPRSGQPLLIAVRPYLNGHVTVRIYDLMGERVRVLQDGDLTAAQWNQLPWDGKNEQGEAVASGLYFVSIQAPGFKVVRKVLVLR
jgi:hypothetical protein